MKVDLTRAALKSGVYLDDIFKFVAKHSNVSYKELVELEKAVMFLIFCEAKSKNMEGFIKACKYHAAAWFIYGYVLAYCGVDLMDISEV